MARVGADFAKMKSRNSQGKAEKLKFVEELVGQIDTVVAKINSGHYGASYCIDLGILGKWVSLYTKHIQTTVRLSERSWHSLGFLQQIFLRSPNWFPQKDNFVLSEDLRRGFTSDLKNLSVWLKKAQGPLNLPNIRDWVSRRSDYFYMLETVKYIQEIQKISDLNTKNNRSVFLICASCLGESIKHLSPEWLRQNELLTETERHHLKIIRNSFAHIDLSKNFVPIDDFLEGNHLSLFSFETEAFLSKWKKPEAYIRLDKIIEASSTPLKYLDPLQSDHHLDDKSKVLRNHESQITTYVNKLTEILERDNEASLPTIPDSVPSGLHRPFLLACKEKFSKQTRPLLNHETDKKKRGKGFRVFKAIRQLMTQKNKHILQAEKAENQLKRAASMKKIEAFVNNPLSYPIEYPMTLDIIKNDPENSYTPTEKSMLKTIHTFRYEHLLTNLRVILTTLSTTTYKLQTHFDQKHRRGVNFWDPVRVSQVAMAGAYASVIPKKVREKNIDKLIYLRGFILHSQTLNPSQENPYESDWTSVYSCKFAGECLSELNKVIETSLMDRSFCPVQWLDQCIDVQLPSSILGKISMFIAQQNAVKNPIEAPQKKPKLT